jgi:hypothetical protein
MTNLTCKCLQTERVPGAEEGDAPRLARDLPPAELKERLTARIKTYAQRVYKRVSAKPITDRRVAGICQRENGFYIETVRLSSMSCQYQRSRMCPHFAPWSTYI